MYSSFRVDNTNQVLLNAKQTTQMVAEASAKGKEVPGGHHATNPLASLMMMSSTALSIGQGITNKLIAKNNSARLYELSVGRISIDDEIQQLQLELTRVRSQVRDKNERERREAEILAEQARLAKNKKKRFFEFNMDPEYWSRRHIYPYALDPAPLRLPPPNQMDTYNWDSAE